MVRVLSLLGALSVLLAGCVAPIAGGNPPLPGAAATPQADETPAAVAADLAAAGDGWSLYSDPQFQVTLRYPPAWSAPQDPGESVIRSGSDGFFQITAASVAGPTAEAVCRQTLEPAAIAKDPRFGTAPTIQVLTVAGQPACQILPSPDQPESPEHPHVSLLVIEYPETMRPHSQLQLWADTDHIWEIARTLEFVAASLTPTTSAPAITAPDVEPLQALTATITYTDTIIGYALDYPAAWQISAQSGWLVILTSFTPSASGTGGIAPGQAKIDVAPDKPGESKTLERLVSEIKQSADGNPVTILREERWRLAGDIEAVRIDRESDPYGTSAVLAAVIHGRSLRLTGYGDLTLFDAIAATLHPVSQPDSSTSATEPVQDISGQAASLGKLAFVRDGALWIMDLPDGQPLRVTDGGSDALPRWSPAGDRLAFQRNQDELWTIPAAGDDARQIEECSGSSQSWAWSPSGDRLACATRSGGLVVVMPDGSERLELVKPGPDVPGSSVGSLAWSPDGETIAYARLEIQESGQPPLRYASLNLASSDGSGSTELLNAGNPSDHGFIVAGWTFDGQHILYWVDPVFSGSILADGVPLYSIPAEGGSPVELGVQDENEVLLHADFVARARAAGPLAGEVAGIFGGYRATWTHKHLGIADATTGHVTLLTSEDVAATSPDWSPDGEYLAYSAMPDTGDLVGGDTAQQGMMARRIYVVNTQGEPQSRPLTDDPAYRDELPLWSADGTHILFARLDQQSRVSLWLMTADGGDVRQVVEDLPLDPQSTWFGYYGHMDWQSKFDWWRGPAGTSAAAPSTVPASACREIVPGMPVCLHEGTRVGGQLALVEVRRASGNRPAIIDLAHGSYVDLGETPARLIGWSPSGEHLLTARDQGGSVAYGVYRADGTMVQSYVGLPIPPSWLPAGVLPGAADRLSLNAADGSLSLESLTGAQAQTVLGAGSLGPGGRATVSWSSDGWLAWSLTTDQLAELGSSVQELHVQDANGEGQANTWTLSQDVQQTYFQLLEWAPGTRLILAARGQVAGSLWSWGVPLVTIDADTGRVSDLGVSVLLSSESHAWNPIEPGVLAVAAGGSRYLYDPSRLIVLDVKTGERRELTLEGLSVFEPAWSPDGTLLAYAAVPATPNASGDGATLERTLQGRAIYIVDPANGQLRKLTEPGDALDGWPQWSADDGKLLYVRIADGHADVHTIALDGAGDEVVLSGLTAHSCYYGGCAWGNSLAYSRVTLPLE